MQTSTLKWPDGIAKKYHIGRKLGSGASGTVFLVYDYLTCETFALKQIKKPSTFDRTKDRTENECNIMRSIKHPCVVRMLKVYDIQDFVYILLEFMEGGDLLSCICNSSNKCLSEQNSKLMFYQMCHAVKYLHNQNIAHRDLKPDNMLLSSSKNAVLIKIADFGLSKIMIDDALTQTICGTSYYIAPEVLYTEGRGKYTIAVDIWSLGVVLYTCLSGTFPFNGVQQTLKGDFKFGSSKWLNVSKTAQNLIKQMLTVDANHRPSIEQVLQHEWLNDFDIKCKAHQLMGIEPPV